MIKEPTRFKRTGTIQKWKPDRDVFTEIVIPLETFKMIIKRQAVVNSGVTFILKDEPSGESFSFCYPDGITGYVSELGGETALTVPHSFDGIGKGKDRSDKPDYKVRAQVAFSFNNEVNVLEYYHISSFLEHGGAPDKAVRNAFTAEIDRQIRLRDKYKNGESKITFQDIMDSLVLVTSSFSTQTSYENQTKKAINNKFIQDFMSDLIREKLEVWFIENKSDADRVGEQLLINKRSRENAEKTRLNVKKKLLGSIDIGNRVKKFVE